ncbi:MAG: phosphoenolpyruvate-protein kinase (PTS system EI component), partial [Planctomycetota bacterium]
GDFLIVDATEGIVRVRPEDTVREQFLEQSREASQHAQDSSPPTWSEFPAKTQDEVEIEIVAACGNLPEVERGAHIGLPEVALYRTELLYCIDREPPSVDALEAHYRAVLTHAPGESVTFRLLDVDSGDHLTYLHKQPEGNPGLGRLGVRALLANEETLRRQLNALDRAAAGGVLRIAVPKAVDCGELRRVREILFEERHSLEHLGIDHARDAQIGVILETPASVIGARHFADEADFLMVGLDSLQQYLLAADRDNADLSEYFDRLHPYVVRTLMDLVAIGEEFGKPLTVFGVSATSSANLTLLLGAGIRRIAVAPVALRNTLAVVKGIDIENAKKAAKFALDVRSAAEFAPRLDGYGHKH